MKRLALCILISLFMMGCATSAKYTHPTKDSDEFEYDKNQCMQVANEYAANVGSKDDIILIIHQTEQCLEKRGWVKKEK